MLVHKITWGCVTQTFSDGECVGQRFIQDNEIAPEFWNDDGELLDNTDYQDAIWYDYNMVKPGLSK